MAKYNFNKAFGGRRSLAFGGQVIKTLNALAGNKNVKRVAKAGSKAIATKIGSAKRGGRVRRIRMYKRR